ncbi:hypothetical protein JOC77_000999 [Peribacillus deserti]|uniref:Uncharacterized protein n=1 Tax=Peribacillus deserti TaxID=673318 RepID=A0ABS2QEM2_9BACI|nr:hypothetical protein [Peribacillus deserti]
MMPKPSSCLQEEGFYIALHVDFQKKKEGMMYVDYVNKGSIQG